MKIAVLDKNGKDTGRKVDLSQDVFGIEPNNYAIRGFDIADYHIIRTLYGESPMRGIYLGFDHTQGKENKWVELRRFENFEWNLLRHP